MSANSLTVLSIDPGYDRVGWAVGLIVPQSSLRYQFLAASCIQTSKKDSDLQRYQQIQDELTQLCHKHQPSHVALESLFFSVNKKTALKVSQARGIIIAALMPFCKNIFEYTPTAIKQTVTGSGNADKDAVKKMIQLQLKVPTAQLVDDTVDAIAIGVTHAVHCCSPVANQKQSL